MFRSIGAYISSFLLRRHGIESWQDLFSGESAGREFLDSILLIIDRDPEQLPAKIKDLLRIHQTALRTMDQGRVHAALIRELLHYGETEQSHIASLLPLLPEEEKPVLLRHILSVSRYHTVRREAIGAISGIRSASARRSLYSRAERLVRKELYDRNRAVRNGALSLIGLLPGSHQLRIFRRIFRSSYRFHTLQLRAVRAMHSLSDEQIYHMMERIVQMRDVDEKIVFESYSLLEGIGEAFRRKILIMLLKNAPYDQISLRTVQAMDLLPDRLRGGEIMQLAYKSVRHALGLEDPELRAFAATLISRFDDEHKYRLIMRALEGYHTDIRNAALNNLLTLPGEDRVGILDYIFSKGESVSSGDAVWLTALRMIRFLEEPDRTRMYRLAFERIGEQLDIVVKNPYYYAALSLVGSLGHFPESLPIEELRDRASRAVRSILKDQRKTAQLLAVEQLDYFPPGRRVDLIKIGLESDFDEVILRLKKTVRNLPDNDRDAVRPFYLQALVQRRIIGELKNHSLTEIQHALAEISPYRSFELFSHLEETHLFPVQDLARFLARSAIEDGIFPATVVLCVQELLRSDNEKVRFFTEFLFGFRENFALLHHGEIRVLYRLIRIRHRRKEKGITGDMVALMQEVVQGRISLTGESRDLFAFFHEEGIHQFDFLIYNKYRELQPEQRPKFVEIIHSLNTSILRGLGFAEIRALIEKAGIESGINSDFIFSILLQLIPLDSAHLSRDEAHEIFWNAVRHENDILGDLKRILPELVDRTTGEGVTVKRPSFEVIRRQIRDFERRSIEELLSGTLSLRGTEKGCDILELFEAKSLPELKQRIRLFLSCQLREQLSEIAVKFDNSRSRFEALNALGDLAGETFRETLQAGMYRVRQQISRDRLDGMLYGLIRRLDLDIPSGKYIGDLKPGDVVRLMHNHVVRKGQDIDSFLREFPSVYSGWDRVLRLLRNGNYPQFYDPGLAGALEQGIARLDPEENRKRVLQFRGRRMTDPFRIMLDLLEDGLWGDLRREAEEGLSSFEEEMQVPGPDVLYRIGKSAWLSIYGGLADVCIAKDARLFARDYFTLLSMIQEDRYVGFHLVHVVHEEGKRYFVLAGCEPSNSYASRHSPEQIYEEVRGVLLELGKRAGVHAVVQIADENAYSNREKIKQYIKRKIVRERPDGYFKRNLYLGSYGVTGFKAQGYYLLGKIDPEL